MHEKLPSLFFSHSPSRFFWAPPLSDIELRIASLLSELQILQTELQNLKSEKPQCLLWRFKHHRLPLSSSPRSAREEGSEVMALQTYLAKDPLLYPEAVISGYYGALTEAAVKRFQQKNGIVSSGTPTTTGYGTVGPKTRAALNALLSSTYIGPSSVPSAQPTPIFTNTPTARRISLLREIAWSSFPTARRSQVLPLMMVSREFPSHTSEKASGPGSVTFSSLDTNTTTAFLFRRHLSDHSRVSMATSSPPTLLSYRSKRLPQRQRLSRLPHLPLLPSPRQHFHSAPPLPSFTRGESTRLPGPPPMFPTVPRGKVGQAPKL